MDYFQKVDDVQIDLAVEACLFDGRGGLHGAFGSGIGPLKPKL